MASAKRDYYEVLGVARGATPDEIKRAYKKLAIAHHPDRNQGDHTAEEKFKEASEAYAVLSDADKRRRYDLMGHAGVGGADGSSADVDLGSVAEILEGLIGEMFRGGRRKPGAGRRGRDIRYDLEISFEEAALGAEKSIEVARPTPCATCKGSGAAAGTSPELCSACAGRGEVRFQRGFFAATRACEACNGTGKRIEKACADCKGEGTLSKNEELVVKVPPGVEDGSVRTVRGHGEVGPAGTGDLHVYVKIKAHPFYVREGADITCTVPISFPQAVLGAEIDVPTLEGKVKMRVPAGSQSGKVFRLRGKGIAVFGGYGKGDQPVKVMVEAPETVTPRQQELLEQLAREMGEESHPQQRTFLDKLKGLFE